MPCFSRITQTSMRDAKRIAEALGALERAVTKVEEDRVISGSLVFTRDRTTGTFSSTADEEVVHEVARKYAEIGVRVWAQRNGFNITEKKGQRITLVNRRG